MENIRPHSRVRAEIDLDAVEYNYDQLHNNLKPGTKMISVLKANGYGCGAAPIAKVLQDYSYLWGFATASFEEAMDLREAGITKPILLLGYSFPECYPELIANDLRPAVFTLEMAQDLSAEACKQNKTVNVHIKVDTGMGRIGIRDNEEGKELVKQIAALPGIKTEGIFTHFARADEFDKTNVNGAFKRYKDFVALCEADGLSFDIRHCSNSASIIDIPEANMDAVRSGIANYGLYPSTEVDTKHVDLKPILSLYSHVAFVKDVEPGTPVSYGGTWVAPEKRRIATIPVGYADGYCRQLSNKGRVLIAGKSAPIVGRVCMDQMMVDVTDIPGVKVGDKVTLIGTDGAETITAEELGDISGRFNYETLTLFTGRVPRVYYHHNQPVEEIWFK